MLKSMTINLYIWDLSAGFLAIFVRGRYFLSMHATVRPYSLCQQLKSPGNRISIKPVYPSLTIRPGGHYWPLTKFTVGSLPLLCSCKVLLFGHLGWPLLHCAPMAIFGWQRDCERKPDLWPVRSRVCTSNSVLNDADAIFVEAEHGALPATLHPSVTYWSYTIFWPRQLLVNCAVKYSFSFHGFSFAMRQFSTVACGLGWITIEGLNSFFTTPLFWHFLPWASDIFC